MVVETKASTAVHVSYVNLPLQMRRVKAELLQACDDVLESGQYILGPKLAEFERQFASMMDTRHAIGVSDGTAALVLSVRALGIGLGDEVIVPVNAFYSDVAAIVLAGARPVFVDVRDIDRNIDADLIADKITSRTKAIMPVHLSGHPADMVQIMDLVWRHNTTHERQKIHVIEDAVQSVGSMLHGRRLGGYGHLGCFSFHPLKTLHSYGDGGMIVTEDGDLAAWLRKARNHGLIDRDHTAFWSTNDRLDELQAAMLLVKLQHLDEWIDERIVMAERMNDALAPFVRVPASAPGARHIYQTYTIQCERRDELQAHLAVRGVEAVVHYPTLMIDQANFAGLYTRREFPVADRITKTQLSLPLYVGMTDEQVDTVIEGVRSFYGG